MSASGSDSTRGLKRTGSGSSGSLGGVAGPGAKQSTLSFTSRKAALPPTPEKKLKSNQGHASTAPTTPQAPTISKSLPSPPPTPAFFRQKSSTGSVSASPSRPAQGQDAAIISREGGAIEGSVPASWNPFGSAVETDEMIENLVRPGREIELGGTDDEDEDELLHANADGGKSRAPGLKVRKAMVQATYDIARAQEAGSQHNSKSTRGKAAKGQENSGAEFGAKLDPKDKRWDAKYWEASKAMSADEIPPIHCTPKSHTRIHHILRLFDLETEYGPCVGLTRLQRWERAKAWGLNPPEEIRQILLTHEGAEDDSYRETVFHNTGIYVP